ncbi:hypothetical protein ACFL2C_04135, partial [Patescibacteria group bacterium]
MFGQTLTKEVIDLPEDQKDIVDAQETDSVVETLQILADPGSKIGKAYGFRPWLERKGYIDDDAGVQIHSENPSSSQTDVANIPVSEIVSIHRAIVVTGVLDEGDGGEYTFDYGDRESTISKAKADRLGDLSAFKSMSDIYRLNKLPP